MLASLLLAGLLAVPLATAAIFVPRGTGRSGTGVWPWTRRLAFALVGTAVGAAAVAAVLALIGVTTENAWAAVAGLVLASLLWLPLTRRWNARAHLCWAWTTFLFVIYLVFMFRWTLITHLGPVGTAGGLSLWVLELFAALLGCAYLWELCDALGSERWQRRIRDGAEEPTVLPMVSLQVPAYNEPPEMVIQTLRSLKAIDYPRYEVILVDDNTDDEACGGRWSGGAPTTASPSRTSMTGPGTSQAL